MKLEDRVTVQRMRLKTVPPRQEVLDAGWLKQLI